jgi:hypothetical protein
VGVGVDVFVIVPVFVRVTVAVKVRELVAVAPNVLVEVGVKAVPEGDGEIVNEKVLVTVPKLPIGMTVDVPVCPA